MRNQTAVSIHHQLSSGQSGVCIQTSAHKSTRWIYQDLGVLIRRQHPKGRTQHFLPDLMLQLPKGFFFFVLAGHNDGIQTNWSVIFIFHRNLCLSVWQDSHDVTTSAACRQFPHDAVRQNYWHRHELRCLIAGISHHDALIPGTAGKSALNRNSPCPAFSGLLHRPGNVRTLPVDERIHVDFFRFIACALQHFFDDFKHLRLKSACDLSCHDDVSFGRHHLAGHPGIFILFQTRIQNAVCDQVAELIRVSFRYGFRCIKSFHNRYHPFQVNNNGRKRSFLEHFLPDLGYKLSHILHFSGVFRHFSPEHWRISRRVWLEFPFWNTFSP